MVHLEAAVLKFTLTDLLSISLDVNPEVPPPSPSPFVL